jgi:hypothetical protein
MFRPIVTIDELFNFLSFQSTNQFIILNFKSPLLLAYEFFINKQLHKYLHNKAVSLHSIFN